MSWILFAFLSPLFFGVNFIVDKYTLTNHIKNSFSYTIFLLISNILFLIPGFFLINISIPSYWIIFNVILGSVFGLSIFFLNRGFELEEVSRVAILTRLIPVFVVPLAYLVFEEILTPKKYLGIFLLILSTVLVSYKKSAIKRPIIATGLIMVLIFVVIVACVQVAIKYTLNFNDYWSVFYWNSVGNFLGGILLFLVPNLRKSFISDIKNSDRIVFPLRFLAYITYIVGQILFFIAVKFGSVSIVSGISSIQPFVVLVYSVVLTLFFPRIISEDINKTTISLKLSSILLIIVGTWLIV